MSDERYFDHPLPVGTILVATDYDTLWKVIVDCYEHVSGNDFTYTVYTLGTMVDEPNTQTSIDFEEMVGENRFPDWEIEYRPHQE